MSRYEHIKTVVSYAEDKRGVVEAYILKDLSTGGTGIYSRKQAFEVVNSFGSPNVRVDVNPEDPYLVSLATNAHPHYPDDCVSYQEAATLIAKSNR